MVNEDVIDLYNRVHVGSKVVVLPMTGHRTAARAAEPPPGERRVPTSLGGIY
jgi:hypothetical protein